MDEFPSGESTPTRGSSAISIGQRRRDEAGISKKKKLFDSLLASISTSQDDDDGDGDNDDESFVTMEEIKDADFCADFCELLDDKDTAMKTSQANQTAKTRDFNADNSDTFRRLSHHLSRELVRRRSSIAEALPDTPAGWTVLMSTVASALLGYELQLQKSLSSPPLVFGQCGPRWAEQQQQQLPLQTIYQHLTKTSDAILSQPIKPSLFVGTRGSIASTVAYAMLGPAQTKVNFSQELTMSSDGARIKLDWELPLDSSGNNFTPEERQKHAQIRGGIAQPLVLVMTGMNNDTSFGYVRALMRTFTDRGWLAVAMNFRGTGHVPLSTPRPYNGGYTGDIRNVCQYLESLLSKSAPLFLVGNSLSANLVTKYLGEEGRSGTLPPCIKGAVCMGNPLLMHANNLHSPWREILALGVKKDIILNWKYLRHMTVVPSFRESIYGVFKARDIGEVDKALAPIFIRNEPYAPFAVKIGFDNAEHYWAGKSWIGSWVCVGWLQSNLFNHFFLFVIIESSSFNYIQHISVPCLQIVASDDAICYKSFQKKLAHCIQNPNVMCVETKCGGHLGWQEASPDSSQDRWADRCTADFFAAILEKEATSRPQETASTANVETLKDSPAIEGAPPAPVAEPLRLRSKL